MSQYDLSFYNSSFKNLLINSNKNNKNFNIDINKNKNNMNIIDIKIGPHMENRENYFKNYCFWFSINLNDKKIYKTDLRKCSLFSGTEILNLLEKIAKKYKLKKIEISDNSYIEIMSLKDKEYDIFLRNMYILSEGISWYNKFGYISNFFEEEKEYNRRIMEMPLSDYMVFILEINLKKFEERFLISFNIIKEQFDRTNLSPLEERRRGKIKKIIKEKYEINNIKNITDNILYEAYKIYYEYDKKKINIEETNIKFMEYIIHITSSNLLSYIRNTYKISDVIKSFRKKIKNIRLDDNELEFIKYILDSSDNILKYDGNLIKIIE